MSTAMQQPCYRQFRLLSIHNEDPHRAPNKGAMLTQKSSSIYFIGKNSLENFNRLISRWNHGIPLNGSKITVFIPSSDEPLPRVHIFI
jgi:hypothetical protein